jgi:GR25 family glycosyltransferase involved in LPS biosynthesis
MISTTIYATKSRHLRFLLIAAILSGTVYAFLWFLIPFRDARSHSRVLKKTRSPLGWGVATRFFVISLARRTDRRVALVPLLEAHGLVEYQDFEFIDATDASDSKISQIMGHIQSQRRKEFEQAKGSKGRPLNLTTFKEAARYSPSIPWGSDLWATDAPPNLEYGSEKNLLDDLDPDSDYPILIEKGNPFNPHKFDDLVKHLQHGTEVAYPPAHNNTDAVQSPKTKGVAYLTRGMVACWHSHAMLIRRIALLATEAPLSSIIHTNSTSSVSVIRNDLVYIILEDDVDFEWDIDARLKSLWPHLPIDWNIVMLGMLNIRQKRGF